MKRCKLHLGCIWGWPTKPTSLFLLMKQVWTAIPHLRGMAGPLVVIGPISIIFCPWHKVHKQFFPDSCHANSLSKILHSPCFVNAWHITCWYSTGCIYDRLIQWFHQRTLPSYEPVSWPSICAHHRQCIYPQVQWTGADVWRVVCATLALDLCWLSGVSRGVRLEFLPPYSPDLNPIEEAFSAIKLYLRRHRVFVENEFMAEPCHRATDLLLHAVFTVTEQQSQGWFRHSGYI